MLAGLQVKVNRRVQGMTALHRAFEEGNEKIAHMLLLRGRADPTRKDWKQRSTPKDLAVKYERRGCIALIQVIGIGAGIAGWNVK